MTSEPKSVVFDADEACAAVRRIAESYGLPTTDTAVLPLVDAVRMFVVTAPSLPAPTERVMIEQLKGIFQAAETLKARLEDDGGNFLSGLAWSGFGFQLEEIHTQLSIMLHLRDNRDRPGPKAPDFWDERCYRASVNHKKGQRVALFVDAAMTEFEKHRPEAKPYGADTIGFLRDMLELADRWGLPSGSNVRRRSSASARVLIKDRKARRKGL
ncbi:MAG: hypothetical protein AB7J19_03650 [Beijerinckiaceae bacterium]